MDNIVYIDLDNYEFASLSEGFEKPELDTEIKNARTRLLAWAKELKPEKQKGMNK